MLQRKSPFASVGLLVFITCCCTFAGVYFVAPDGDDDWAGTKAAPLASVRHAHDKASPGDTIFLRGGTYYPTATTRFTRNGSADGWFCLKAWPGDERPVIDGSKAAEDTDIWDISANYWVFEGPLLLTNGQKGGIQLYAVNHVRLSGIEVSYSGWTCEHGGSGIRGWYCRNVELRNCDSHHNANHLPENDPANQYQHGDGYRFCNNGPGNRLVGCRAWRNTDDNFDFINTLDSAGFMASVEVDSCWSVFAGYDDARGSISGTPNREFFGQGFKCGYARHTYFRHTLRRCVSAGNRNSGFLINGGPFTLLNCSAYGNAKGFNDNAEKNNVTPQPHTIRNCLSFANRMGAGERLPNTTNLSGNSWQTSTGVTVTEEDFAGLEVSQLLAPRKPDGGLPDVDFLKLKPAGDLIDAGVKADLAFEGDAPDVGAFEYSPPTQTHVPGSRLVPPASEHRGSARIFDVCGRAVASLVPGAPVRNLRLPVGVYSIRCSSSGPATTTIFVSR